MSSKRNVKGAGVVKRKVSKRPSPSGLGDQNSFPAGLGDESPRRPNKRTPSPMLRIPDVAAFCNVSVKTVRRFIDSGDLPAALLGGQWRIRPRDLEEFIRKRIRR